MATKNPTIHHPCWSNDREHLWQRIHLPVAKYCNVKCVFCDHKFGSSCHTSKPGFASRIMTVQEAVQRTLKELRKRKDLRIVAVSGPGEPLYNEETFETLTQIRELKPKIQFCLSTNGTLIVEKIHELKKLDLATITVSMSAISPDTVGQIYEWGIFNKEREHGKIMAANIVDRQLRGIVAAAKIGVKVKVNTILIPEINGQEIAEIATNIAEAGASIHNIVPLIPNSKLANLQRPTATEIQAARAEAAKYLPQFVYCKQCRSDVVGIPGCDSIL
ncbi:MAG: radical SAM protein [Candidatus Thorarchaeota archaeon]